MDFDFPNEIKVVKRTAREFAHQGIAPRVEEMERTGEFPPKLIREMAEVGLLGLITPKAFGGAGLGYLARTVALQEIGRVSAAVGLALQVHHMQVAALSEWGSEGQKRRYLPALDKGKYLERSR